MRKGKQKTQSEFIEELKLVQPDLTVIGEYINSKTYIEVVDELGIRYLVIPNDLLSGNKPTIQTSINKNDCFSKKANIVHNNKYDYSEVEYVNNRTKVSIICPDHGEFTQIPVSHLSGIGCPKCGLELCGWTDTKWEECGNKSKHFESFKVYVIECWNENERFYKIGKTFVVLGKRFCGKRIPYQWVLKKVFTGDAKTMSELERKLHNINKELSYTPLIEFRGMTECFKKHK